MRDEKRIMELSGIIRQTAFDLHSYLRHGHLEKVYENGLANRLHKQDLKVIQQHPLDVHDEDGALLGNFFADLYVEDCLIVELKACKSLAPEHFAQVLGYLRASGHRDAIADKLRHKQNTNKKSYLIKIFPL